MKPQQIIDTVTKATDSMQLSIEMLRSLKAENELLKSMLPTWRPIEEVLNFGYNVHVVCKERERKLYKAVEITKYTKLESMIHFYSEFIIIPTK